MSPNTHTDRHVEREVHVDRGPGGPGTGAIVAALVGLIVVVLLGWMLFFGGGAGDGDVDLVPGDTEVNIEDTNDGADFGGVEGGTSDTQDTTNQDTTNQDTTTDPGTTDQDTTTDPGTTDGGTTTG